MPSITAVLGALGNDGAVANARRALDVRDQETRLVAGLTSRLDQHDLPAAPGSPAENLTGIAAA